MEPAVFDAFNLAKKLVPNQKWKSETLSCVWRALKPHWRLLPVIRAYYGLLEFAAGVPDALHMAIMGADNVALDESDTRAALETLSYAVIDATAKCAKEWKALQELSQQAGGAA
jgi:hypothetical protein